LYKDYIARKAAAKFIMVWINKKCSTVHVFNEQQYNSSANGYALSPTESYINVHDLKYTTLLTQTARLLTFWSASASETVPVSFPALLAIFYFSESLS